MMKNPESSIDEVTDLYLDEKDENPTNLAEELFKDVEGVKSVENTTSLEIDSSLPERPVFVWGLGTSIESHEQLVSLINQVPELKNETQSIGEYVPTDVKAWESHKNIIKTGGSDEDISNVLRAWEYTNTQFDRLYHNPTKENLFIQDYWDGKAMSYHKTMDMIIHPEEKNLIKRIIGGDERYSGVKRVENLLFDSNFENREEMLDYLTYRLWLSNNKVKMTKPHPGEEINNIYRMNKEDYDQEKEHLMPLVVRAIQQFAEEGKGSVVRKVLENLETMDEIEVVTNIITSEGLSDSARLTLAVQGMNVFGVVPIIETITEHSKDNESLTNLYNTLQGQDIQEVMTSLTQIYKSIDFHEYVLNNPELTLRESRIIQDQIQEFADKFGKPVQEVRVVDVGAGTGRLAVVLHDLGYNITALDYEQHHVKRIKEQDPSIKTSVADWHNMPFPNGDNSGDLSPEVFYCFGRTVLHNNTPEKMARFFDEMHRVLTPNGIGIIDIPKIPEEKVSEVKDQYADEISRYSAHLESLGVETGKARNIFDGPDEKHKFNRMTTTDSQFRDYAKLFGFKVNKVEEAPIGDGDLFDNSYYIIEKDPDFEVDKIDPQEFIDSAVSIGMLDPGVDYNKFVDAWGLPMGIPMMYMAGREPEKLKYMRDAYRKGKLGEVSTQMDGGAIYFEVSRKL